MRHFCTYFDHNYLPRGMLMLESLHEHCPDAHVHVLCLSEDCHAALSALAYPYVSLTRLAELEAADPELAATRSSRSLVEYYFTLTPCLPWHLLQRSGLDEVTYLDADMLFFSSPEPLFAEAGDASVIITPHRFSSHLAHCEIYGLYNVSWLTFRNTAAGRDCLAWYRASCLEWCCDRIEEARFADQKYLEVFPKKFPGVFCMRHPGGGVAPWNVEGTAFGQRGNDITVNGESLIFYHAQALKHILGPFYASGLRSHGTSLRAPLVRNILLSYVKKYAEAVKRAQKVTCAATFSDIRFDSAPGLVLLRKMKLVLVEARHNTLIHCL